ncbi:MAG: LPXTG cell wall anchor domain-containing protein [Bacilli bacterium]|nr:LPXTG cell wall anchor domain-containing protein [Bacilli bacterium]
MRNYIRYIVVLVLIIAGALLLISVINKFTEPDVSKVNNNAKTEEKDTTNKDNDSNVTLDVEPTEDKDTTNESNGDTTAPAEEVTPDSTNPSTSTTTPETDNVTVPNTGTKENIAFIVIGLITITTGIAYIKKHSNN